MARFHNDVNAPNRKIIPRQTPEKQDLGEENRTAYITRPANDVKTGTRVSRDSPSTWAVLMLHYPARYPLIPPRTKKK